ncbi:MAG TPA: tRNA preQ1(34) S-adenosylmethionine ribosyltransferase-isomerase QueA [Burkholderiales bacterium]|nr:tRNA preQ1(34) S-adenosylmethionine ribosyltransferase-isomerase QueA [Burkholderiales bacterium]
MLVSEFDYELPGELIAQQPAPERTSSRLLRMSAATGAIEDLAFGALPSLLGPEDAVVVNDTRVVRARLAARKRTGGKIEVFVERPLADREALALIRASHPLQAGAEILLGDGVIATVLGRQEDLYRLRFSQEVAAVLERLGAVPLPPYIRHEPGPRDTERYQTVYAANPGAVAAPTAGLHFSDALLQEIRTRGAEIVKITLHVGAGTFQPVRSEQVEDHKMHKERYAIPPGAIPVLSERKVLAVGTTTLRTLETHALTGALSGETDLFIYPGFQFMAVDRLLTNFHLPKSTLLMLACAFGGKENVLRAYRHAIEKRYRFFSYGDAMLIER